MRKVFRMKYVIVAAGLAALTVFAAPAAADHFEPNSSKDCGIVLAGQVNCTLTINIQDEFGVPAGENISATITNTPGATFVSASLGGGTCVLGGGAGTEGVTVANPTTLVVTPDAAATLNNCTIIVNEVLAGVSAGAVCQTLNSASNAPPFEVCDNNVVALTAEDCKKDGWKTYGIFKNQGDCVSFVATNGRNGPAGP